MEWACSRMNFNSKIMKNMKSLTDLMNKILVGFILVIVSFLSFLLINCLFSKNFSELSIGNYILFITFLGLVWYAWETRGMKKQMFLQNEMEQNPFLTIFLRDLNSNEFIGKDIGEDFILGTSQYTFRIRNIGKGPAFDVEIESDNFVGKNFETKIFAPLNDEHCVQIVRKDFENGFTDKSFNIKNLDGERFHIFCKDSRGVFNVFEYKIVDANNKIISYEEFA